jgi:hypothetical protein
MFTTKQLGPLSAISLLGMAALFSSRPVQAQLSSCSIATGAVCYYVAIQPIDVCSSTGTGCAPFNTSSKIGNPGAATSTTPIGFVDATTGKDITRALLNQIGVDIAWSPIKLYKNTTYQTLHVTSCQTGTTNCTSGLTSSDFMTLSQQNQISQATVGFPNPTPPNAPVATSPNMLNMFFVNTLVPPVQGTTLYGFSWPGNNGIVISTNTFFPPFGVPVRFDNLAHELGHNLGLDHTDQFNYGGNAPSSDLMTNGTNRTAPVSTTDALTRLSTGDGCLPPKNSTACTADQLNSLSTPNYTFASDQQDRIAQSGFLNPIALSTTSASSPGTGDITTALVVSDTVGDLTTITAAPKSTKANTSINFFVEGPFGGPTLVGLNLTLGKGLHFDPTNPANFSGNSFVTSFSYDHGNTGDAECPTPATQCLLVQLSGLPEAQDLIFSQGIVGAPGLVGSSSKTVTVSDIATAGATITYKFSDGLIITSDLTQSGCCELFADSQHPDTTVPAQINPNIVFTGTGAPPCTPTDGTACPDPVKTGGSDGNPFEEPGNPPPP